MPGQARHDKEEAVIAGLKAVGESVQKPLAYYDNNVAATNPYGQTKLVIEDMLRDLHRSDPAWRISILRYFNPVAEEFIGVVMASVARQSRVVGLHGLPRR